MAESQVLGKVLVVDDDDLICQLLIDLLSRQNLSVVEALNGYDALKLLSDSQSSEDAVDVVLTDVNMPGMNGIVLMEEIKKISPQLPVIVMTGWGSEDIAVKSLQGGAFNFCRKPFNVNEIVKIVKKGLEIKKSYDKHREILPFLVADLSFDIPSDVNYIRSVIQHIYQLANQLGFPEEEFSMRVKLAIDEALGNSIRHGNKKDRNKKVKIHAKISPKKLQVKFTDEGIGFDVSSLPDPKDPENLNKEGGRGVLLMGYYMDEISYNDKGNEVILTKYASDKKEEN